MRPHTFLARGNICTSGPWTPKGLMGLQRALWFCSFLYRDFWILNFMSFDSFQDCMNNVHSFYCHYFLQRVLLCSPGWPWTPFWFPCFRLSSGWHYIKYATILDFTSRLLIWRNFNLWMSLLLCFCYLWKFDFWDRISLGSPRLTPRSFSCPAFPSTRLIGMNHHT